MEFVVVSVKNADRTPQGTVLGPTLFNLYINSLTRLKLKGSLQLYADDSAIVYGENDRESLKDAMEADLEKIKFWVGAHFMALNVKKTAYVLFSGRRFFENFTHDFLNIMLNGEKIERVAVSTFLGLRIDERLTFKPHIEHIKNKVRPVIFAIRRI